MQGIGFKIYLVNHTSHISWLTYCNYFLFHTINNYHSKFGSNLFIFLLNYSAMQVSSLFPFIYFMVSTRYYFYTMVLLIIRKNFGIYIYLMRIDFFNNDILHPCMSLMVVRLTFWCFYFVTFCYIVGGEGGYCKFKSSTDVHITIKVMQQFKIQYMFHQFCY